MAILKFSLNPKPFRSVTIGGLTIIYNRRLTKYATKTAQMKKRFKIWLEDQLQSIPKTMGSLTKVIHTPVQIWLSYLEQMMSYGADKLELAWIWPWRSRAIAQYNIRILTIFFCTYDLNLMILAWTGGDEFSPRQACHRYTHRHTRRQRQFRKTKTLLG